MKTTATSKKRSLAVAAVLLIVAGVVIPPSGLIGFLRTTPEALREQLFLGAALFKAGLVLQGLFLGVSVWLVAWKPEKRNEMSRSNRVNPVPGTILAGILLAALILRLYKLEIGIWFDEIGTYVSYVTLPFGEILTTYDNQNNHLLYTLLARASFVVFGESVWSLRLPAVLFGVGSIWAVYLLSCQVTTRKEGFLAAGFLTFSYHHVWFSQNGRGYTALLFWTLLSSWFLIRALRDSRAELWVIYGVSTALGMMTHVTMAFVVLGQGLVYVARVYDSDKGSRRQIWFGGLFGFTVAALVTFQLYALVLPQLFNWRGVGVSPWQGKVAVMPWKSPVWMMEEIFSILNIGLGSGVLLFLCIAVIGAGLIDFLHKKSPIVILFTIPVLTGVAVIMGLGSTLLPRLFFFATGFAVIVLVRGLMVCGDLCSRALRLDPVRARLVGVGLSVCVVAASGISVARAYQPKQDYGGALEFVQNQRRPGDTILTVGLTVFPYRHFYKVDWDYVTTLEELDRAKSRGTRTWLVYTMPIVLRAANPEIMNRIESDFEAVREFPGTLNGGNIVVALTKS